MRWYQDILDNEQWLHSLKNSHRRDGSDASGADVVSTIAALGLSRSGMCSIGLSSWEFCSRQSIVPLIITAAGLFFYSIGWPRPISVRRAAHTALGSFVVITVTATLSGFDRNFIRHHPAQGQRQRTFFVILPLISGM